ncbi:MAG: hypothetical protein ACO1N6_05425 [Microcella sp.]
MGVLTNLAKLTTMGFDNLATMNVGAQLAQAQATMDGLIAQNELRTAAAGPEFVSATATVTQLASTGVMVNDGVQVALGLLVLLPAGVPVPVTTTTVVPMALLPQVQPGASVAVRVDPAAPSRVLLDLR